jgi:hypothetical protein
MEGSRNRNLARLGSNVLIRIRRPRKGCLTRVEKKKWSFRHSESPRPVVSQWEMFSSQRRLELAIQTSQSVVTEAGKKKKKKKKKVYLQKKLGPHLKGVP